MKSHLTSEERAAYWQRTLAPEALLEVSDHLEECAACREELARERSAGVTTTGGEPVSYAELVAWMENDLDPLARRELAERISRSPKTSAELVNLLRFRDETNSLPAANHSPTQVRRFFGIPSRLLPLAAGLTIGLAFLWLSSIGREHNRRVALLDQGQQLVVRQNGAIPALGDLPQGLQETVRQAVSLGKIDLPTAVHDLGGSSADWPARRRRIAPCGPLRPSGR